MIPLLARQIVVTKVKSLVANTPDTGAISSTVKLICVLLERPVSEL